jgi:hypothetical protein
MLMIFLGEGTTNGGAISVVYEHLSTSRQLVLGKVDTHADGIGRTEGKPVELATIDFPGGKIADRGGNIDDSPETEGLSLGGVGGILRPGE